MIKLINPHIENNKLHVGELTIIMVYNSLTQEDKKEFIKYILDNDENDLIDVNKQILRQLLREKNLNNIIDKL